MLVPDAMKLSVAKQWNLDEPCVIKALRFPDLDITHWHHKEPFVPDFSVPYDTVGIPIETLFARRTRSDRTVQTAQTTHQIAIVPQGSYGSWEFDGKCNSVHIAISKRMLNKSLADSNGGISLQERMCVDDPLPVHIVRAIARTALNQEGDNLYMQSLTAALAAVLTRNFAADAPTKTAAFYGGGLSGYATKLVCSYMHEHMCETIKLDELAALAGLSPYHFVRQFKRSMGMPPHRYLASIRIEKAKHLLVQDTTEISTVAQAVGYSNANSFARSFRAEVGVSPTEWRMMNRGSTRSYSI
jgi:AraC family transcriptional regulator